MTRMPTDMFMIRICLELRQFKSRKRKQRFHLTQNLSLKRELFCRHTLTYTWCQRRDRQLHDAPLVRTPAPRRLWVCVSAPLMAAVTSGQRHATWTFVLRGSSTFRRGCGLASGAGARWAESFPLLVFRRTVPSRLPPRPPSIIVVAVARLPSLQVDPLGGPLALPAELVMVVTAVWAVRGNFMWHYGNVVLLGESAVLRSVATVAHGILRRRRDRVPPTAQVDCPPSLVPWEGE